MDNSRPLLEARSLHKSFENGPILADASLRLDAGSLALLSGPSGSGKTTFLRLIAGFEQPDAGRILLHGKPVEPCLSPRERGLAFAFQDNALWPHKTVAGHLRFVLASQGLSKSERTHRIDAALDVVELRDRETARPHELSGGEQQRLGIARALVTHAPILLLDEPFANLDENRIQPILDELKRRMDEEKTAVVLATHQTDAAQGMQAVEMPFPQQG
jgi:ABC-type Fe3+/spermidine/putrescine transport system ATPase subunit